MDWRCVWRNIWSIRRRSNLQRFKRITSSLKLLESKGVDKCLATFVSLNRANTNFYLTCLSEVDWTSSLNFLRDENLTDFRHLACGEATRGIHGAVYTTGNAFGKAFPFGHLATTDFAKNWKKKKTKRRLAPLWERKKSLLERFISSLFDYCLFSAVKLQKAAFKDIECGFHAFFIKIKFSLVMGCSSVCTDNKELSFSASSAYSRGKKGEVFWAPNLLAFNDFMTRWHWFCNFRHERS